MLEFQSLLYTPNRTQMVCVVRDAVGSMFVMKVVDWRAAASSLPPEDLALLWQERVRSPQ